MEHAAITSLGSNHVAVMGSLEEGGFLHLVCLTDNIRFVISSSGCLISANIFYNSNFQVNARYSALVGESKVKTTQHSGAGLHWVQGTLFLAGSSKLLALSVSGLDEGLQGLLGSALPESSSSPYTVIPELLEKVNCIEELEIVWNF